MGLVQSEADDEQETFDIEGFAFGIESSLRRFVPVYGKLVVDFRQSFFGEGFQVNFSGQPSC
jgi:hypothetical protein